MNWPHSELHIFKTSWRDQTPVSPDAEGESPHDWRRWEDLDRVHAGRTEVELHFAYLPGAGLPSDTDAAARWTGRPKDPAERTDKYPILTFSLIANKCSF